MTVVTSRLLALILALLIGSPVCWCCAQSAAPVKKAVRSCCERKKEQENSRPAGRNAPCPCSSTMIQRDIAKSTMNVPPPVLAAPAPVEFGEFVSHLIPLETSFVIPWNDTGPPHERVPVYLRQQSLLL